MTAIDYSGSIPCYLPKKQTVKFVYSEPQNHIPFYLARLLAKIEPEFEPKEPSSQYILDNAQLHEVTIGIGKGYLADDVPAEQIASFLHKNNNRGFIRSFIFLSPEKINILLDRATRNFLADGGHALCLDSGILFTRDLARGEKIFMITISRTPTKMNCIKFKLGRM